MLEQTNPLAAVETLPELGECGCRLGTAVCAACESRGARWWGAAGAPSWGHSAAECSAPPKQHPRAAPRGYGRVILLGGHCRDHGAARTPTPPTAGQTPAPPEPCSSEISESGPSEPPLQSSHCPRILPKQALVSGASPPFELVGLP